MCKEVWSEDSYAISMLQGPDVVGHLPQQISLIDTSGSWNITRCIFITQQISYSTVKESNCENKLHVVKTRCMV